MSFFPVALKELTDARRNRWLQSLSLVFFVLALGVAYFGGAVAGRVGFTGLSNTVVSLASLGVFIIPLIALMLSYDCIVGEEDDGTLLLLRSYPISLWQLFLGKWLGRSALLLVCLLLGFGSAGLLIAFNIEEDIGVVLSAFSIFILSSFLLGIVYIGLGIAISAMASSRNQAAGIALLLWFISCILFDIMLLAVLVASEGKVASDMLAFSLLLNPTDIFRIINFNLFSDMQVHTGLMAVSGKLALHNYVLFPVLCLWLLVSALLAYFLVKKRTV